MKEIFLCFEIILKGHDEFLRDKKKIVFLTEICVVNRKSLRCDSNLLVGEIFLVFTTVIKINWIDSNSFVIKARRKCWIDDFVISI